MGVGVGGEGGGGEKAYTTGEGPVITVKYGYRGPIYFTVVNGARAQVHFSLGPFSL